MRFKKKYEASCRNRCAEDRWFISVYFLHSYNAFWLQGVAPSTAIPKSVKGRAVYRKGYTFRSTSVSAF
jgi:hypothetical protein